MFVSPKRTICVCLSLFLSLYTLHLYVSPRAGMSLHVKEGVKEYDMDIEPKSCKLKLLGKLVVQQPFQDYS